MQATAMFLLAFFAAAAFAVAVTNAVYYFRAWNVVRNTVPVLRSNVFGANSNGTLQALAYVNLVFAIIAGLVFCGLVIYGLMALLRDEKSTVIAVPVSPAAGATTRPTAAVAPPASVTPSMAVQQAAAKALSSAYRQVPLPPVAQGAASSALQV